MMVLICILCACVREQYLSRFPTCTYAPEECHWTEWFTLQWQVSLTGFVGLLGAISYHILYISIMHIGGGFLWEHRSTQETWCQDESLFVKVGHMQGCCNSRVVVTSHTVDLNWNDIGVPHWNELGVLQEVTTGLHVSVYVCRASLGECNA